MQTLVLLLVCIVCVFVNGNLSDKRWSVEKASQWQTEVGWRAGVNFIPSNAVNQLEMFQADTYDPVIIEKELVYAENLGFKVLRVYLHDLLWKDDEEGLVERLDNFLDITHKHNMGVMFVLFDSCWNANPKSGKQPPPTPGVHNSQWVQSPGYDIVMNEERFKYLALYAKGIVGHFKNDKRIIAWDIWNEPTNSKYTEATMFPLVKQVFTWMREVNPSQPITTAIWQSIDKKYPFTKLQKLQLDNSDVISFHSYSNSSTLKSSIAVLKEYAPGRPLICSEYMQRPMYSFFKPHLKIMRDQEVMAISWGLVAGKTNTIYSWETTIYPNNLLATDEEPYQWFHDIFRKNGKPYRKSEIEYITKIIKQYDAKRNETLAALKQTEKTSASSDNVIDVSELTAVEGMDGGVGTGALDLGLTAVTRDEL